MTNAQRKQYNKSFGYPVSGNKVIEVSFLQIVGAKVLATHMEDRGRRTDSISQRA